MKGINKVILIGIVGADPEIKNNFAKISLATSEKWRDKTTNEAQERTEWHKVVCYGKLAEIVSSYVGKGSKIYIEGSLRTNKWTDANGVDKYTTNIVASNMQMLDGKKDSSPSHSSFVKAPSAQFDDDDLDSLPF